MSTTRFDQRVEIPTGRGRGNEGDHCFELARRGTKVIQHLNITQGFTTFSPSGESLEDDLVGIVDEIGRTDFRVGTAFFEQRTELSIKVCAHPVSRGSCEAAA